MNSSENRLGMIDRFLWIQYCSAFMPRSFGIFVYKAMMSQHMIYAFGPMFLGNFLRKSYSFLMNVFNSKVSGVRIFSSSWLSPFVMAFGPLTMGRLLRSSGISISMYSPDVWVICSSIVLDLLIFGRV